MSRRQGSSTPYAHTSNASRGGPDALATGPRVIGLPSCPSRRDDGSASHRLPGSGRPGPRPGTDPASHRGTRVRPGLASHSPCDQPSSDNDGQDKARCRAGLPAGFRGWSVAAASRGLTGVNPDKSIRDHAVGRSADGRRTVADGRKTANRPPLNDTVYQPLPMPTTFVVGRYGRSFPAAGTGTAWERESPGPR